MSTNSRTPSRWLPGQVAHGAALQRRAVEGDPRGDRVGLDDRPVGLVLVRVGLAPAGLLVERLVVPDAGRRRRRAVGRRLGDDGMEGQRPDVRAVLPQVLALDEALLVARLLGQRPGVVPAAPGDGLVDRRPEAAPPRRRVRRSGTTTNPSRRKSSTSSGVSVAIVVTPPSRRGLAADLADVAHQLVHARRVEPGREVDVVRQLRARGPRRGSAARRP